MAPQAMYALIPTTLTPHNTFMHIAQSLPFHLLPQAEVLISINCNLTFQVVFKQHTVITLSYREGEGDKTLTSVVATNVTVKHSPTHVVCA